MSEAITIAAPSEASSFAAIKIRVYQGEASTALAPRLVEAERQVEELTATIRAMLLKEQGDVDEAVADRRLMAEKLGSLLKANVSRAAFQQILDENSGLKREIAALKRDNPLSQENLELRRRIAELELRVAGDHEGADARARMNADASRLERGEEAALARARARKHHETEEEEGEGT